MSDSKPHNLAQLRERIREIDNQLIQLSAERLSLAKEVGRFKLDNNLPIKDYRVEKEIIERVKSQARALGVYEKLIEDTLKLQIEYSVLAQEEFHTSTRNQVKSGKKILIIGGAGKMGQWLAQYLESFGHYISIFDSSIDSQADKARFRFHETLAGAVENQDFIVLATPISATANVLRQLVELRPTAIIFDICSLKSPIIEALQQAAQVELKVSSVHPMFGPGTDLLAGKNIVFCSIGNVSTDAAVRELFEGSTANLINLDIEEHDRLMSVVLGLSHMLNLAFGKALLDSNLAIDKINQVASSTFRSQMQVTLPVINENKELYYEIQSGNIYTERTMANLLNALQTYQNIINKQDRAQFIEEMAKTQSYLK